MNEIFSVIRMEDMKLSMSVKTASKIATDLNRLSHNLSSLESWLGSRMDWNEAHMLSNVRHYIEAISQRFTTQIITLREELVAEGIRNHSRSDRVKDK